MMQIASSCTKQSNNPSAQKTPQSQTNINADQHINNANGLKSVIEIEDHYYDTKEANKIFKQGFKAIAVLKKEDHGTLFWAYRVSDITEEEIRGQLKNTENGNLIRRVHILKPAPAVNLL